MSLGLSEQEIAELRRAIATGATTVKYADRTVSYRSLDEMLKILNLAEGGPRGRRTFGSFDKFAPVGSGLEGMPGRCRCCDDW